MTIGQDGIINISGDGVLKVKGNVAASVVNPLIAANMITTDSGSTTPTTLYDGTWTWVMSPNNSSLAKPNTPSPASGATVYTITDLTWLPGSPTHTWDLYLGTDANNLSLVASGLTTPEYKMACLDFQKKYYWKVNEFNGSSTISGDVWNFTTYDYTKLFWFEYANQAALDSEWTPANSQIAVSTNPARGAASLAMTYNNTASPYISRAVTTAVPYNGNFACTSGVALSVWVYGNPANGNDPVYASISDGTNTATTVCTISGITQAASWTIWNIDVREFTANNPNVDMTKITSVTLGVGNPISPAAGGSGTVYFDNVNLYPVRCLNKPAADTNGDCVINFKDFAEMAAEWLSSGLFPVF
jgi:hypothetical protein